MDKISLDRINKLHPKVRQLAIDTVTEVESIMTGRAMFRVTFGLRTMSEQECLYEQGRTTCGPIVTNAMPGHSYHNYGLALDFAFVIDGKTASWDINKDWNSNKKADWLEVVDIFKKHGWEWGGDWKSFKDMPHFQMTFGHSISQLLAIRRANKIDRDGYVII